MKKKVVALFMCGVLAFSSLAGCGKSEPQVTQRVIQPSPTPIPTVEPTPTTVSEDVVEEVVEGEPVVEEAKVIGKYDAITAPEGFADVTYGGVPLSTLYVSMRYVYQWMQENGEESDENWDMAADSGMTVEEFEATINSEDISAEDYTAFLDKMLQSGGEIKEEDMETNRQLYSSLIYMFVITCGLTDDISDERAEAYKDGSWCPDGTLYEVDRDKIAEMMFGGMVDDMGATIIEETDGEGEGSAEKEETDTEKK